MAGPVTEALSRQPQVSFDGEDAFTAGLMHDIGKTALANSHRDEYEQVIARVYNERVSFVEAERDFFGFRPRRARCPGGRALGAAAEAGGRHRAPPQPWTVRGTRRGSSSLTALVAISTACLTRLGVGRREPVPELDLSQHPAWTFLGLGDDLVEPFLAVCRSKWQPASRCWSDRDRSLSKQRGVPHGTGLCESGAVSQKAADVVPSPQRRI